MYIVPWPPLNPSSADINEHTASGSRQGDAQSQRPSLVVRVSTPVGSISIAPDVAPRIHPVVGEPTTRSIEGIPDRVSQGG